MRALLFLIAAVLLLGSASGFAPTAKGSFSRNIFKMQESLGFNNQESYINYLKANSALPAGFLVGASRFNFKPMEVDKTLPMNLTIIMTEKPTTSFAAMFTSNEFCGGPIIVGRERMKSSKQLQAIVVNNKISNVCPGGVSDRGAGDSESICEEVAKYLKLESKNLVFPSSTGIIGWRLPVKSMLENGVPGAVNSLQKQSILPAALGITTTDRYPKVRSYKSPKGWSVVGTAKGAGMIEPNMATMLCYILTDLDISKSALDGALRKAVTNTFNTISVDGDQSTSDTVLAVSSQKVACSGDDEKEFAAALKDVCLGLSEDIIRNGEGTQHVVKVTVTGAPSDIFARDVGRFVINSNLVKCAIAGCDPNVGRIVGAIGSYLGTLPGGAAMSKGLSVTLGGIDIFKNGAFQLDPVKEKILSDYMLDAQLFPADMSEKERKYPPHSKTVDITIAMQTGGTGTSIVIGSDLTKEYVEENADYRS